MVADTRADMESVVFCWGSISAIRGWTMMAA